MADDHVHATADALNARHGLGGALQFRAGPGGLVIADIRNAHASASVCLQGGQLLQWQPRDQAVPVLWLSDSARYAAGKAIRGGIPVCWPWFGAPQNAGLAPTAPAHGFARTLPWQVTETAVLGNGESLLRLCLDDGPQTRALWPERFHLELQITVGASLALTLITANSGAAPLVITQALHSYFRVGSIDATTVQGLAAAPYYDAVLGTEVPATGAPITFGAEVDRVYDSSGDCRIEDPALGRRIHIAKTGSASTVVWNPWQAKAERLGDMAPAQPPGPASAGGWQQMVCVESGNARHRAVQIAPGANHVLSVHYAVEPLLPLPAKPESE
jgi:D-hexose-6-phosphate mutarotase